MIDENKLKEQLFALVEQIGDERLHIDAVVHLIDDAPAVDAVEVVRCRNCKKAEHDTIFQQYWCRGREVDPDGYCSNGEQKDGERHDTK